MLRCFYHLPYVIETLYLLIKGGFFAVINSIICLTKRAGLIRCHIYGITPTAIF